MLRAEKLRIGCLPTFYHTAILLQTRRVPTPYEPATWELFPTGPAMMKAFAEDRLDLGYAGLPPAIIAMSRGLPICCVAGGHMEGTVIIGQPEFRSSDELGADPRFVLPQFRGKALGTPAKGSIHDVILRHLLQESGLDGQVEVRNYPVADLITLDLEARRLDGAVGTPALAVAGKRYAGTKLLVPPSAIWPNNPSYGIVALRNVVESDPERLEVFLRAHKEACSMIRLQPDAAAAYTAAFVGVVGVDFVTETYRMSPKYCAALPPEFIHATESFVPVLKDLGYLGQSMDRREIFDTQFIGRVHPEPAHYDERLV